MSINRRARTLTHRHIYILGLLLLLLPCMNTWASSPKKLIEFGWDEPGTDDLQEHLQTMEQRPFDGVVMNVHFRDDHHVRQVLEWVGFGKTQISWDWLKPGLANLQATHFHRFTDNFLRFNTAPGDVDWFDDFSAIINNAGMAARFCKQGRLKGVLFDAEAYGEPLFEYPKQKYQPQHSFAEYAVQVKRRGAEIMEAFQKEYPGLTVFMTLGYDVAGSKPEHLLAGRYGLFAPFLDGLYSAARGRTRIVDGFESSYPYQKPEEFDNAYQVMRKADLAICGVPEAYKRRLSCGFGVWMDWNWRKMGGWHTDDFSKNHQTPELLEATLTAALRRSDEYVWLYSEKPNWWTLKDVPPPYLEAVRRARHSLGMENP